MKTILVCTDGSAYASSLYDHAIWAARRLDASIHVLHLIEPAPLVPLGSDYTGGIGLEASLQLTTDLAEFEQNRIRLAERRARALLDSARARFTSAGISADRIHAEYRHGRLVDAVAELSATHDLVLLGKRGEQHDPADRHLGDNLERLVRTSAHPVLVTSRAFQPIERLLLAYDGGHASEKAVTHLIGNPLLRGLPCHLLSIGTAEEIRESTFIATRDRLAAAGYTVRAERVTGTPSEIIAETVRREHMSLLVMGAYGHGRIRQFFVGSTTADMLRACPIPVLLFR